MRILILDMHYHPVNTGNVIYCNYGMVWVFLFMGKLSDISSKILSSMDEDYLLHFFLFWHRLNSFVEWLIERALEVISFALLVDSFMISFRSNTMMEHQFCTVVLQNYG
jgi:hypothetical protein